MFASLEAMKRLLSIDREDGKRDLFAYKSAGEMTRVLDGLVNNVPTRSVTYGLDNVGGYPDQVAQL